MLNHYLRDAIDNLQSIIHYTRLDMEDVRVANNDAVFKRSALKVASIGRFEQNKGSIDEEMMRLAASSEGKDLRDLLDDESSRLLSELRSTLDELKEVNSHYARMVFAVSEFYTSLVELMIPKEKADYKSEVLKSQLLRVQA